MLTHGMDPDQVEWVAGQLAQVAFDIDATLGRLEAEVNSLAWVGPDADRFKAEWWPRNRSEMATLAASLREYGDRARAEAAAQREISGR